MENPHPICARCQRKITGLWIVTQPAVWVLCGEAGCQAWARAQGLRVYATGDVAARRTTQVYRPRPRAPRRPRATAQCATCRKEIPVRRHAFRAGSTLYCTLTCLQAAG